MTPTPADPSANAAAVALLEAIIEALKKSASVVFYEADLPRFETLLRLTALRQPDAVDAMREAELSATMHAQGFFAGIESAAVVADHHVLQCMPGQRGFSWLLGHNISAAIRALKPSEVRG